MKPTDPGHPTERGRAERSSKRELYEKPEIVDRGRLVEVALGGSPGTGDSGGGALVEDPLV